MIDFYRASEQNCFVSQEYVGSCEGLTASEIISRLECVAYRLAHDGDSAQAMAIFVTVAEMELAQSVDTRS